MFRGGLGLVVLVLGVVWLGVLYFELVVGLRFLVGFCVMCLVFDGVCFCNVFWGFDLLGFCVFGFSGLFCVGC